MKIQSALISSALVALCGLGAGVTLISQPEPVQAQTVCGRNSTERAFETRNYRVYICRDRGRLFYLGQSKSQPRNWIRLVASYNRQNGGYTAYNGNTSYFINASRLRVYQNGRQILNEAVLRAYR